MRTIGRLRIRVLLILSVVLAAALPASPFGEGKTPITRELEVRRTFWNDRAHVLSAGGAVRGELVPAWDYGPILRDRDPERLAVVFVHGLDTMFLEGKTWSPYQLASDLPWKLFASAILGRQVMLRNPTRKVEYFYWGYRPTAPFPVLAEDLAFAVREVLGDRPLVLVTHSAGALLPRFAHGEGLLPSLRAVIGIAATHGGVQGASFILADESIERKFLEDPARFGPPPRDGGPHRLMRTIRETRSIFLRTPTNANDGKPKISREVMASVVWGNEDGAFSEEDRRRFEIPVQALPPIRYPRFDHLAVLDPKEEDVSEGLDGRELPYRCQDLYRRWAPEHWRENDSTTTPYRPAETTITRHDLFMLDHAYLVFHGGVVGAVLDQVDAIARGTLELRAPGTP